ncbi:MAG: sarcosine oxidase subunit delta [Woeseiales bacterium]
MNAPVTVIADMIIECPHCGERHEDEFVYGGDVRHARPENPDALSDAAWRDYIYSVPNTKGWAKEHWWHVRGCNRWIVVQRNSVNNELRSETDENYHG